MRVGLFTKGLILVAIPLVLQLITIFYFVNMYNSATESLRYQTVAVDAAMQVLKVADLTHDLADSLIDCMHTDMRVAFGSLAAQVEQLNTELSALRSCGLPYTDISSRTDKIADLLTGLNLRLAESFEDAKRLDTKRVIDDVQSARTTLSRHLDWLGARAMEPPTGLVQLDDAPVLIQNAMIVSMIVNLLTAVLMWYVIRRSVVSQIQRMEVNFRNLSENRELMPPLKGDDEVAAFDRSFHDIVDGVLSARLERQEYLDIVSSSLRKPLLDVDAFLASVERQSYGAPNTKGQAALTAASRSLKRLIALLNELIDFDQIERGTMTLSVKNVKPSDVLNYAIDSMKTGGEQPTIVVETIENEQAIQADPDRLVQVIINLLANAIKFSSPESTITLSILQTADDTVISVEDQGQGIPDELKDRVFSRFEQVDPLKDSKNQKGSGLGLFICKTIVDAHGGEIWVESTVGMGSKFSFSIPKCRELP